MLNRWRKSVREGCVLDCHGRIVRQTISNRCKDLSRNAVKVAISRAAESEDASAFFAKKMAGLSIEGK